MQNLSCRSAALPLTNVPRLPLTQDPLRSHLMQLSLGFRSSVWLVVLCLVRCLCGEPSPATGGRLMQEDPDVQLWWALSSASKIQPDSPAPTLASPIVTLRTARSEWECVQIVVRASRPLHQLRVQVTDLAGPGNAVFPASAQQILRAHYVQVQTASDRSTKPGAWPDPIEPITAPMDVPPQINQSIWLRVHSDSHQPAGTYRGQIVMQSKDWQATVPFEVTVYNFTLPDRLTCQTALGFSPEIVFRYHRLTNETSRRLVLSKYWDNLAAHHISPYDPAPLDPIRVDWPAVSPPASPTSGWLRAHLVTNEVHQGQGALLVYDDQPQSTVMATYEPLIPIPPQGLRLRFWYRTALPGHRAMFSLNHYDAQGNWISGNNLDMVITGDGRWQSFERDLKSFPAGARSVRLNLMGTAWTEAGEKLGLIWYDDVSLANAATGEELLRGGDFEPVVRQELIVPADQLRVRLDFAAWDKAMAQAWDVYHFNSFSAHIPGLGGGTFHELAQPSLLGFQEQDPEYPILLSSYARQLEAHLREKGWLKQAYVYWFDEPSEDQYPYLQNGFAKLKRYCPDIPRMLTKLVEPGLIGGPNLWCPISDQFDPVTAAPRRALGERFWWYVCTGPKAPYAGLFLDHPAPEMRVWLWQTYQRHIEGILVWQCNYWTSDTAYPASGPAQNPFADPMSWTTGYGTPAGQRIPWGNGDGRFIYPPRAAVESKEQNPCMEGPIDSIRWEQLRDGLEDYEYLVVLKRALDLRRAGLTSARVAELEELLAVPEEITRSMTDFTQDGAPIELQRHKIARAIESLSVEKTSR